MLSELAKRNIQHAAEAQVAARSSGFADSLHLFLARLAPRLIHDEVKLAKEGDDRQAATLEELMARFGTRHAADAFDTAQVIADVRAKPRAPELADFSGLTGGLRDRAGDVVTQTRQSVRDEVQRVIADASGDGEQPTATEIVRELNRRINAERGFDGAFTWERAMRIARTELSIAQNTGTYAGYKASGIDAVRWLAYKSPIFARRHDLMADVVVAIGEKFELPSGATCYHPGDASLPAGDLVHCRCSQSPERSKPGRLARPR